MHKRLVATQMQTVHQLRPASAVRVWSRINNSLGLRFYFMVLTIAAHSTPRVLDTGGSAT